MTSGFLFPIDSPANVGAALLSIESLRRATPDARVAILSSPETSAKIPPFAQRDLMTVVVSTPTILSRYSKSPFDITLVVTPDSFFARDCTELFALLTYYDICYANVTGNRFGNLPETMRPLSTDVLAYRKSERVERLFNDWTALTDNQAISADEAFALALANADARTYAFHPNWNAQIDRLEKYRGWVNLVTGTGRNLADVARAMNTSEVDRIWVPEGNTCMHPAMGFSEALKARRGIKRMARKSR